MAAGPILGPRLTAAPKPLSRPGVVAVADLQWGTRVRIPPANTWPRPGHGQLGSTPLCHSCAHDEIFDPLWLCQASVRRPPQKRARGLGWIVRNGGRRRNGSPSDGASTFPLWAFTLERVRGSSLLSTWDPCPGSPLWHHAKHDLCLWIFCLQLNDPPATAIILPVRTSYRSLICLPE